MSVTEPTIALTREILIAENMQQGNWEELGKVSLKFHKEGGNYTLDLHPRITDKIEKINL